MKMDKIKFPRNLDFEYVERAAKKTWKNYDIPDKWKGTKREKLIRNLRQYSNKPHTEEAKRSSLSNLQHKPMNLEKEKNLEEKEFALANELIDKIGLSGKLKKEEALNKFLFNIGEVYVLNKTEQLFYTRQFLYYLVDYSDLNNSDDIDNLHNLILERILIKHYRIQAKNAKTTATKGKYEKMMKQCFTRLQKYESNLFTRRRDRAGMLKRGKSWKDLAKEKDILELDKKKKEQIKDVDDWIETIPVRKKNA